MPVDPFTLDDMPLYEDLVAQAWSITLDWDLARDAVQEALCAWAETWGDGSLPDEPANWLRRVTRNKAIDIMRRRRNANTPLSEAGRDPEEVRDGGPGAVEGTECARILHDVLIPRLPEREREVWILTLQHVSTAEIAHLMETTVKYVYKLRSRALAMLRRWAEPYLGGGRT